MQSAHPAKQKIFAEELANKLFLIVSSKSALTYLKYLLIYYFKQSNPFKMFSVERSNF